MNPTLCARLVRRLGLLALLPTLGLSSAGADLRVDRPIGPALQATSQVLLRTDIQKIKQLRTVDALQSESIATIKRLWQDNDLLEKQKTDLKASNDALEAKRRDLTAANEAAAKENARLNEENVRLQSLQASIGETIQSLETQRLELKTQSDSLQKHNLELTAKITALQGQKQDLSAETQTLLNENSRLKDDQTKLIHETKTLDEARQTLVKEKATLDKELEWKSLLAKILSGSTITSVLAVLGFFQSRRRIALENEKLLAEIKQLRDQPSPKNGT